MENDNVYEEIKVLKAEAVTRKETVKKEKNYWTFNVEDIKEEIQLYIISYRELAERIINLEADMMEDSDEESDNDYKPKLVKQLTKKT